jgi:hypothetical protein
MRIAGFAVLLITMLLAVGGATAFAQGSPSERGYDESLGVIGEIQSEEPPPTQETQETPTPTPPPPVREESDLPFTGLDLGIVALMGATLLGTGLVLRRTTRQSSGS